jgi:hypothetical protein
MPIRVFFDAVALPLTVAARCVWPPLTAIAEAELLAASASRMISPVRWYVLESDATPPPGSACCWTLDFCGTPAALKEQAVAAMFTVTLAAPLHVTTIECAPDGGSIKE